VVTASLVVLKERMWPRISSDKLLILSSAIVLSSLEVLRRKNDWDADVAFRIPPAIRN
jgi:hypothetical protein